MLRAPDPLPRPPPRLAWTRCSPSGGERTARSLEKMASSFQTKVVPAPGPEPAPAAPAGPEEMATFKKAEERVATAAEVRAWCVYDWANSPFWQVVDPVFKLLLARIAEMAEAKGSYWLDVTAGSYAPFVLGVNSATQVVVLLCCSGFADYGNKTGIMRRCTLAGSFACASCICLFDSALWPLAGALRILCGTLFVAACTMYNSLLPVLASHHHEVVHLAAEKRGDAEARVMNDMSSKGQMIGYLGGLCHVFLCLGIQLAFGCDPKKKSCSDFSRLFLLSLCISLGGVWWSGFSMYTFRHLKCRPGAPFPGGSRNMLALGCHEAWEGICTLCRKKYCGIMMIAFFLYSDALNTMTNLAVFIMEDSMGDSGATSDVHLFTNFALAGMGGAAGVFFWCLLQGKLGSTCKFMILCQIGLLTVISVVCAFGLAGSTMGFYATMTPLVLTMGSLQANSRSLFSQLVPLGHEGQMCSIYMILDRGSSLIGAFVVGIVHNSTGEYAPSYWYCTFAFVVGASLLLLLDMEQGQQDAGRRSLCISHMTSSDGLTRDGSIADVQDVE